MATFKIADTYNPLLYAAGIQEAQVQQNAFIQSGIAYDSEEMRNRLSGGGNIIEIPNMTPLAYDDPNLSTDDDTVTSTPKKVTSSKTIGRVAYLNQSWSTMDLALETGLRSLDPVGSVINRLGGYWANVLQKRVIKSLVGILADNVANDSSDMLYKIGNDVNSAVTDAERISSSAIIRAIKTLGDAGQKITGIAMHSVIYYRLLEKEFISFIPDSQGRLTIPTYAGLKVIFDDEMPTTAGSYRVLYTCILFGENSIAMSPAPTENPSEMIRKPDAGRGSGEERIYSRSNYLIHPAGFSFTSSSVADKSASTTELATAANWDRKFERKNCPFAFLQVND